MLGSSFPSTLSTFDSGTRSHFSPDIESHLSKSKHVHTINLKSTRWKTHATGKTPEIVLSDEDKSKWEACKQALSGFEFSVEEEDKILGKAFGLLHSPFWGEEREKVVPKFEEIDAILAYLRDLDLSNDDISKVLKKFPEVVGCSLENELKTNIQILEKQWGIKGKSLRNLLLRNPKVLGYIVDCKGDCMALCTRCWVRF
ncbi:uncharacterized protein [Rutidosis leptorrhynchoides]|uniref:uncharacterized protein n=1 Tax=Rutidosis leptorrhynchoides TaxID=125765 RepID=UPI003A99E4E4